MEDDTVVDLWHGTEGEPDATRPQYISKWYPDYRWRKYLSRLRKKEKTKRLKNFARYYCRKYNRFDPGPSRLAELTIDYYRMRTQPDYQPRTVEKIHMIDWYCFKQKER
jgi:hypothetical protein